jgi:hypothetical protein
VGREDIIMPDASKALAQAAMAQTDMAAGLH